MRQDNIVENKSKMFAVRIINLYKYLTNTKKEYVLSKQLLRSGTSIGANIKEALCGQSRDDFAYKLNISLKEASETEYWLDLLMETDYISKIEYESIHADCVAIIKLLTSILRTTREDENNSRKD